MNASAHSGVLDCFEPADLGLRPAVVGTRELAEIFGLSETRVRQLAQLGLPRRREGEWELIPCFKWYAAYLQKHIAEISDATLKKARQRLALAQAEREEIKLLRDRREFVSVVDVRKCITEAFSLVRERFLYLPGRVSQDLVGCEREKIESRLTSEVHEILRALAAKGASALSEGQGSPEPPNPRENALERKEQPILQAGD